MKTAAENGDPRAQNALGYAYDVGDGVTQDLESAVHWYRQAAEQGYANAQFNLAEMIRDGAGVPQSNKETLQWYIKAGMQGHSRAQYNVAMMYVQGEGVTADNVTAYAWLVLSATGDAEGADQARDIVGKGIGDKIAQGDALAQRLMAEILGSDCRSRGKDGERRFRSDDEYKENRAKQIAMSPRTVAQLRSLGVTDQTALRLEFFFYTDTEEKGVALTNELKTLAYEGTFGEAADNETAFVVTGWSTKMPMDEQTVVAWTALMCDSGQKHDCEFDGWGTNPKQD